MATEVIMPVLGLTMESGVIVEWMKQEGEPVAEGEVLFTVETDKSVMEVEAKASGVLLKILHGPGDSVPIQQAIAYIGAPGEKVPVAEAAVAWVASAGAGEQAAAVVPEASSRTDRIKASPKARKRAQGLGVRLDGIRGTGPGGRIVFADVEAALQTRTEAAAPAPARVAAEAAPALPAAARSKRELARTALTGIRKVAASRLAASASTIPHFYVTMEIDMTRAVDLRKEILAYGEARGLARVSFNDMLIKAAGMALRAFPPVNASLDGGAIVQYADVHVGFAVALDDGLVVPVVPNADQRSLFDIAGTTKALEEKAKTRGLAPDDYGFGTFTLSNLGMFGVDQFTAIINPPEAAILAVGRIRKQPVVLEEDVEVRSMMSVTLSSDHRLIDGATAAQFLARIRGILEQPLELLIQG
jgi:pyruvate dehydrogenase E2 component (dihydrolipoamide acetyltransferase)